MQIWKPISTYFHIEIKFYLHQSCGRQRLIGAASRTTSVSVPIIAISIVFRFYNFWLGSFYRPTKWWNRMKFCLVEYLQKGILYLVLKFSLFALKCFVWGRNESLLSRPLWSQSSKCSHEVESSWNVMAHGDPREGKWRGNWRMEWVASTTSHYLGTWCIQHYYHWCAHLGCQ